MVKNTKRKTVKQIRHARLRAKLKGSPERPRLNVFRGLKNIRTQIIDDTTGKVLVSASTFDKEMRQKIKYGGNTKAAEALGQLLAQKAKEKGIKKIAFDRGGYLYHGKVKALADAARKEGLEF
ncbi:50S ribosomal protein L18 [Candidatus Omnitrophota bacterium]